MSKKVNDFLDELVKVYNFEPLTKMRRRELVFKLGMADIKDYVRPEDTTLALDLVLEELQPKMASNVRTASTITSKVQKCPRCDNFMNNVKLSNATNAQYCSSCHVAIPAK